VLISNQIRVLLLTVIVASFINAATQSVMQGTAHVNGTSIYYEQKGRGFPIVFISGGGILDRRGWDQQWALAYSPENLATN